MLAQVFISSSLIPLNLEIKTRSPLTPPKHLTLEMATVHVRHETRRGVVFEDELKKALSKQPNKYITRVANRALNEINGTNNTVR